jgi:hypothetical protein
MLPPGACTIKTLRIRNLRNPLSAIVFVTDNIKGTRLLRNLVTGHELQIRNVLYYRPMVAETRCGFHPPPPLLGHRYLMFSVPWLGSVIAM